MEGYPDFIRALTRGIIVQSVRLPRAGGAIKPYVLTGTPIEVAHRQPLEVLCEWIRDF
ncbi:hypothetical protein GCM10025859_15620 [Alicyclobacillus fastidiosus]|nr:hypothetical protein GCM10025859_15620 [Alicyclobacillus fastidiosus]